MRLRAIGSRIRERPHSAFVGMTNNEQSDGDCRIASSVRPAAIGRVKKLSRRRNSLDDLNRAARSPSDTGRGDGA